MCKVIIQLHSQTLPTFPLFTTHFLEEIFLPHICTHILFPKRCNASGKKRQQSKQAHKRLQTNKVVLWEMVWLTFDQEGREPMCTKGWHFQTQYVHRHHQCSIRKGRSSSKGSWEELTYINPACIQLYKEQRLAPHIQDEPANHVRQLLVHVYVC